MSHVSVFKTQIRNPNPQLLQQAMEALAQQYGARLLVGQSYKDRYDVIEADYVLVLSSGRGIGVKISNGVLEIVGDSYGWKNQFMRLQNQIVQTYVHFALIQQLQQMGYQLQGVQQLENGTIVGDLVRW